MNRSSLPNWYGNLALRDQRVLRFGAAAILLIVVVGALLLQQRSLASARTQLDARQADLEWMRQVAPALAGAGPGPVAAVSQESLVVLIDRSARESGLSKAITGSQPAGEGAMRVVFENADFNLLTAWIARLSSQHGVQVVSASFTSSGPGLVNASVQMRTR